MNLQNSKAQLLGKPLLVPRDLIERAAGMSVGPGLREMGGKASQVWKRWEGPQDSAAGMTISSTAGLSVCTEGVSPIALGGDPWSTWKAALGPSLRLHSFSKVKKPAHLTTSSSHFLHCELVSDQTAFLYYLKRKH